MAATHVIAANQACSSSTNTWNVIWKLTRALQKAGYRYLASSDGSAKETAEDPQLSKWVGTTGTTNAGAAAASIAAPSRGRAAVTGLTGIVAADKGKFLVISGAATAGNNHWHRIEEITSSTAVKVSSRGTPFTPTTDANNGALTWSIWDPMTETIPAGIAATQCWLLMQGPSTIKIPITALPTVGGSTGLDFIRGENIVQASTGWEGELVGYVYDAGAGHIVARNRIRGTGSGIFGLDTANALTGGLSGATVTQVGTAKEYRREIVFWKNTNQTQGSLYWNVVEPVGETTLNSLTGAAGCTITVAPGGGGTGNAYPTTAYICVGSSTGTHVAWSVWNTNNGGVAGAYGNAQIMVADTIAESGYSADGSFIIWLGNTQSGAEGGGAGFAFQLMDDSEEGDLDPYASLHFLPTQTLYSPSRTAVTTSNSGVGDLWAITQAPLSTQSCWRGWRNRGLATGDAFQDFDIQIDRLVIGNASVLATNNNDTEKVASAPATAPKRVTEPFRITSAAAFFKIRKGSARWMRMIQGGQGTSLFNNKTFMQLTSSNPAMLGGPWDGTSIPTQA